MSKNSNSITFNEEVALTGTYTKSVLAKKEGVEHRGHYKLVIDEHTEIVLLPPYREEAKRPAEEVEKFEGKQVIVTGVVKDKTYLEKPSFERQALTVSVPCFTTIKSIELAK